MLPSDLSELIRLHPLSGNEEQVCGIFSGLGETVKPAVFPPPSPETLQIFYAKNLLDFYQLNPVVFHQKNTLSNWLSIR